MLMFVDVVEFMEKRLSDVQPGPQLFAIRQHPLDDDLITVDLMYGYGCPKPERFHAAVTRTVSTRPPTVKNNLGDLVSVMKRDIAAARDVVV